MRRSLVKFEVEEGAIVRPIKVASRVAILTKPQSIEAVDAVNSGKRPHSKLWHLNNFVIGKVVGVTYGDEFLVQFNQFCLEKIEKFAQDELELLE